METPSDQQRPGDFAPEARLPSPSSEEVKAYHRAKRACHIADIVISLLYWIAWCWLGAGFVGWADAAVDSRWLVLLIVAAVMLGGMVLVDFPLGFYSGFILEQRFHLSNQTPLTWLVFQMKTWLVGGLIGGVVLGGLYAALWYAGALWSVWVWVGVMLLSIVLVKVFPLVILPLFYPARPVERPGLTDRLTELADGAGMTITGVYDLQLSKDTRKANAMLAGLGSSRRVYLSDTLLGAFNDRQIAVVFAHELGHHLRGHIFKGIALSAVISSMLVALVYWRLDPFAGADPGAWAGAVAALAQVMLIATLFPLVIAPATNAISRRFERQSDGDALRLTGDPGAYREAFELLSRINLEDPEPPRWEVILFDDHPPLAERIARAGEESEKPA